jgi:uncharacterized protein YlxP (DUF503 family)
MLIAAALIQLVLPEADSLKARRRVANAVKERVRSRFRLSIAEVGDPEDRHEVVLGMVEVGSDPRVMRERMQRVISYIEGLGLAEVDADDVVVVRLDELHELESDDEPLPEAWRRR